jgi:hypothetical protein
MRRVRAGANWVLVLSLSKGEDRAGLAVSAILLLRQAQHEDG